MYEIFLYIAIGSTIPMFVLLILSLIGMDSDSDIDDSVDSDTLSNLMPSFSFKNLMNFLSMFGWVGLLCTTSEMGTFLSILISVISGFLFTILLNSIFLFMNKLSHSNIMTLDESIGKEVIVYSKISKQNPGQVTITLNGSLQTLMATSNEDTFETGDKVKVISVTSNGLVVEST